MPKSPEVELLRLFVAVELPDPVREALADLQGQLRRRGLEGLRWVRPEGIHLTLKFLGETPADRLEAISVALAEAARSVAPFPLVLGSPGTFGDRRGPRVLWVDVAGDLHPLRRLQERVERAMVALGFPPEERPFSPHLTLARVRAPAPRDTAARIAQAVRQVRLPPLEMEVRELSLMRSTLLPEGAHYQRLAAFPLGRVE